MKGLKELLKHNQAKLAVAESLTGGLLSSTIVNVSGISRYYQGGVTAYALQSKEDLLHVPLTHSSRTDGVDAHTAELMARGVAKLFRSTIAIATTGIAERWDEREEQAFVALVDTQKNTCVVHHLLYGKEIEERGISSERIRPFVREQVVLFCMNMLMEHLQGAS